MKKYLCVTITIILSVSSIFADDFTDIIQDLAVQTACIGQYSATQAGGGWYDDPEDYYTPPMMAGRFKQMSGNKTRTETFYGVCFDYAQAAYEDIENYKLLYNNAGMYEDRFWIAGVDSNPNIISLSFPTTYNNANAIQNGVLVKEGSSMNIKTHKQRNGNRSTNHSWLWIMRNDGVWFWIDPTWTDNLGYVVYGCISNGEEIQLRPDEKYCINYPDYLKDLPLPPKCGKIIAPSSSKTTTASTSTTNSTTANSNGYSGTRPSSSRLDIHYTSILGGGFLLDIESLSTTGSTVTNFSVCYEDGDVKKFPMIYQIDFLNGEDNHSVLFGAGVGFQLGQSIGIGFTLYGGGGIGWLSDNNDTVNLAWKINGGIRLMVPSYTCFSVRWDVAYTNKQKLMYGVIFGFCF